MSTVGKTITCKAAVAWEIKKPFSIETVEVQPPGNGEVRVKMVATGLCHSDLSILDGNMDQALPYIPGHEGSGIVESVGEGVKSVKPGDKVFTLFLPNCQECVVCKDGRSNLCLDPGRLEKVLFPLRRTVGYDGTPKFSCKGHTLYHQSATSAFSEYTVIPENSCVKVNPKTPLEKAVLISCGFSTGYGSAVNSVKIRPGDYAAVWGLGGVGLAAVVGCKEKGAKRIIGIDVNPEKEAIAKKFGCTDFICPTKETTPIPELIRKITNGGVHFAFVCIGSPQAMEIATQSMTVGGTTVIIGLVSAQTKISISPLDLLADKKIVGSTIGCYQVREDLPKVVDHYLKGNIVLDDFISGYYKLDEINTAVELMRQGKTIRSIILF